MVIMFFGVSKSQNLTVFADANMILKGQVFKVNTLVFFFFSLHYYPTKAGYHWQDFQYPHGFLQPKSKILMFMLIVLPARLN